MDISSISRVSFTKPLIQLSPLSHSQQRLTRKPNNIVSCKSSRSATDKQGRGIGNKDINLYKVLSVSADHKASAEEIKKAYRAMALQYHPDACHPSIREESTWLFVQLHKAYKTLSDPVLRDRHDREMRLCETYGGGGVWRERWEAQLCELRKRSDSRFARKQQEGSSSWGRRMRAHRN